MRLIVAAGAAFTAFGLFLHAFQHQLDTTQTAVDDSANVTAGTQEALNTSSVVLGDITVPLAEALPLAFGAAFVVMILVMAWGASGR